MSFLSQNVDEPQRPREDTLGTFQTCTKTIKVCNFGVLRGHFAILTLQNGILREIIIVKNTLIDMNVNLFDWLRKVKIRFNDFDKKVAKIFARSK